MLHSRNIYAEGLLRALSAILGPRTIRLIDGLRCPRCGSKIVNDPEETDHGWRLLCRECHIDILAVDGNVS
jgi:DNA-directed RNA polymerase subunit RPC12/RpoP